MDIWRYAYILLRKRRARARPPKKLIFVIEDDDVNGQMLRLAIEQETPYQVLVVSDGVKALQTLQKVKPDLILLDYGLPGMNGLEVYERLRAIPGREAVPVVLLTASAHKAALETVQLPLVEKPFDLDTLFETLHQHLDPA